MLKAWCWAPVRRALEWLIQSGARPSAATILHLEGAGQFPQIRAVWRDRASGGKTSPGAPFPEGDALDAIAAAKDRPL